MTVPPSRPATAEGIFLWIMNRFAEVFRERAVLKGGMAMRLLDSPRSTTDIDYVLLAYRSKKDVLEPIRAILEDIEGAQVEIELHSKMLRAEIRLDDAAVQLEVNVAESCAGTPISTGTFATGQGQPPRVVRMMNPDVALAHKLSAWNERRLLRDLYDCFFYRVRIQASPDEEVLNLRLASFSSRLPGLRSKKSMSRGELAAALRVEAAGITEKRVDRELGGLLPPEELAGLTHRLRAATVRLADELEGAAD